MATTQPDYSQVRPDALASGAVQWDGTQWVRTDQPDTAAQFYQSRPTDQQTLFEAANGNPKALAATGLTPQQAQAQWSAAQVKAGGDGAFPGSSGGSTGGASGATQTNSQPSSQYVQQAQQLYRSLLGREGDPQGIQYWANQLASGKSLADVTNSFKSSAQQVYNQYQNNTGAYSQQNPNAAKYVSQDFNPTTGGINPQVYNSIFGAIQNQLSGGGNTLFGLGGVVPAGSGSAGTPAGGGAMGAPSGNGGVTLPMLANGIPDYAAIAQQQQQYNLQNARQQSNLNNPNFFGPGGSQVRTLNPDGTYSVTQSLNPQLQQNYDAANALQGDIFNQKRSMVGNTLNYNNAPAAPTFNTSNVPALPQFDTSKVPGLPTPDANDLNTVRDSVYRQQTQYLDPQWQQAQSDLESKLANQGIMPGSEAYNREINNFNLAKQKAYGDARDSAIQAGGQEQSRLFGIGLQANQAGQQNALNTYNTGLQSHTAGINDALASFNTGMQGRQQGVSEANSLYTAPYSALASLGSGNSVNLPSFQGQTGTSIPGVDYLNAANMGFNANLGLQNAQAAERANTTNGLFGLGAAALQSGALSGLGSGVGNWFGNAFGGSGNAASNLISKNAGFMSANPDLSTGDLFSFG
jgi:hypothetical protein